MRTRPLHAMAAATASVAVAVAFGCSALTDEQSTRSAEDEAGEEASPATPAVDVAGSYLVGVGPAGADAPMDFAGPDEEVFGAGLYLPVNAASVEDGLRKAGGTFAGLAVTVTLREGAAESAALVAAPADSRWHAFFKVKRARLSDIVAVTVATLANGLQIEAKTTSTTFVPPGQGVTATVSVAASQGLSPGAASSTAGGSASAKSEIGGPGGTTTGGSTTGGSTTGGSTTGGSTTGGSTTGGTTSGGLSGTGMNLDANKQYAFTTTALLAPGTAYDGTYGLAETFASVSQADQVCADAAAEASLPRTWIAVIGDLAQGPVARVAVERDIYSLAGDRAFVQSSFFSNPASPLAALTDENGDAATGTYWTGSLASGASATSGNCGNWTMTSGGGHVGAWVTSSPSHLYQTLANCATTHHLLCLTTP